MNSLSVPAQKSLPAVRPNPTTRKPTGSCCGYHQQPNHPSAPRCPRQSQQREPRDTNWSWFLRAQQRRGVRALHKSNLHSAGSTSPPGTVSHRALRVLGWYHHGLRGKPESFHSRLGAVAPSLRVAAAVVLLGFANRAVQHRCAQLQHFARFETNRIPLGWVWWSLSSVFPASSHSQVLRWGHQHPACKRRWPKSSNCPRVNCRSWSLTSCYIPLASQH